MKKVLLISALVCTSMSFGLFESFENIGGATSNGQAAGANLEASGWFLSNQSAALGNTDWFNDPLPGNVLPGPRPDGVDFIGANFENGSGTTTISNWLLTPTQDLVNGSTLSFWTRAASQGTFPDRLQVRMSTNGSSTNTGTTATDVGDFTNLLLDINPNYAVNVYGTTWTQYNLVLSGLGAPTTGRFAFRYFVEGGGPTGTRSNAIGIDSVAYDAVPEPATMVVLGGIALAALKRKRK